MSSSAVHNDAISPASGLENQPSEFAELVSGCGLIDLSSRAKIALTGSDRVRWLNGMVTNNIRDLAVGTGVYAFLLNPQGHILGDMYAYNRGESLTVETDQSQLEKLLAIFDRYIIMDDVEVTNLSDHVQSVGLAGPNAGNVLRKAGFDFPRLEALQFTGVTWQNAAVTLVRADHSAVERYELWLAPEQASSLQNALAQAGAKPVGPAALELLRIAAGIPRYGQDIRERDLPQETSQDRALHFSKGCYVGQEIVERIRSRGAVHRKFAGFEVQGSLPAPGAKLQAEGKDVGEITSVASLPLKSGERRVAIGYIRREFTAGKQVHAGDTQLTVTNLPFAGIFSSID
ncbi:MAG: folate-binding protein [Terriglobales bacterium]|jgi:folate-binding protein YgfZ